MNATLEAPQVGLNLDARQRAMLQEMGVRVWSPMPSVAPAPVAVVTAVAPKIIAITPVTTGVKALKPLQTDTPAELVDLPSGIAQMDWPALADAVAACHACALSVGRRAPVFAGASAHAWRRADWLVLSDPPTDEAEERLGQPFAGPVGELLERMLQAVGVSRHANPEAPAADPARTAYATNIVKCRPALVRMPQAEELARCEHFLRREVALVQPRVILAMGRHAAQTLLQPHQPDQPHSSSPPLGRLRGNVHHYQGVPVVVTYPLRYLLSSPQHKAQAWVDLCLAREVALGHQL